jgi:hypothetical protein
MEFFNKYKRIFLIIGFLVLVIFFGYLIYSVFFKSSVVTPIEEEQTATSTQAGGFPQAKTGTGAINEGDQQKLPQGQATQKQPANPIATGGVTETTIISESKSSGVILGTDGDSLQYYNKEDGKFYHTDKDGDTQELSDQVFREVEKITWSPNKEMAVLEFPDGANVIYNFSTKNQTTLPQHWKDYDFSPNSEQLVSKSMGMDSDNRFLIVSNSDGTKAKAIEPLGENEEYVDVGWSPSNQVVATYREGIDLDRQNIYFIGLNKENFKSLTVEGRGFQYLWSPKGNQMLYSVYSNQTDLKPLLWVTDANGEDIGRNRRSLNINTWAEKCIFLDESTAYCAVPKSLESGSGLFPEMSDNTIDEIYKIDLKSGQNKLIAIPDNDHTIAKIIVSPDSRFLYFTDKQTGKIYKINLK